MGKVQRFGNLANHVEPHTHIELAAPLGDEVVEAHCVRVTSKNQRRSQFVLSMAFYEQDARMHQCLEEQELALGSILNNLPLLT
jgi:hypothetical protein